MDNETWRAWLDQSRAKQAQLNQQNYAMPSQGWQNPQEMGPMQGNSGAGWGAVDPNSFQQAPSYRPGAGSMTPEMQAAADRAWEEKQRMWDAEEAMKNAVEEQSYAQSRLREGAGPQDMQTWQKYQDVMAQPYNRVQHPIQPPQPPQEPGMGLPLAWANIKKNLSNFAKPFYGGVEPQTGTWEQLQALLSGQRPNQGLR